MPVRTASSKTRDLLIDVAAGEIHRHGYQGANLDRILNSASVTKGALYHYFGSKQALGYAVFDERIAKLIRDRWLSPVMMEGDPIGAMQGVLQVFHDTSDLDSVELGCPLNNLAQEMSPLDEGFRERIDALFEEWERGFAAALALGQSKGRVKRDIDPETTAMFIVSALEGCFGLAKSSRKMNVIRARLNAVSGYLESLRVKTKGR
ncbi:AcrR family transcriptional regulator [Granulicella aggregans]|uniref:AcrR family transcriptional regulator n=1 Tax=Granulicella aggregans TaxID=474949 RepID=A0A7W8E678_9BACT|nr:TetR/AcrR family transcriptional regulator [Granulicella aggregans]MBB5060034.1 AcrR family transcriptional regulator [Granulicella aggregans]